MKNTNRYKLVPVLVIGLVLSAFNAMAEVKTIVCTSEKQMVTIEIKEGEVGRCIFLSSYDPKNIYFELRTQGTVVDFKPAIGLPLPVVTGPAEIKLRWGGRPPTMLSVEITPNDKH